MTNPLADRIRPESLEQVVGQQHLLGPGKALRQLIESGDIPNLIFYGPPGVGKTTVASIIAKRTDRALRRLNGTNASTADIRALVAELDTLSAPNGILLYLDEIQYFNKRQQQSLLEYIENGKITAVESGKPAELSPEDIDAGGSVLLPGFIDAHTHLGIIENGIAFEGDDCNEATDPFTPHLRVIDGVNPLDHCFAEARAAGVTTVMTSPGSANACGGTMAILKTAGRMADRMQIGTGVKFALGENPKSVYNDRDETPITRMATAAMIREGLAKAQRYQQELDFAESDPDEHMPDYDAKSEALLPLLERDVKAHFHCHRADDICTAIRIAKEFNLDYVIIHGTEGHLIADILAEENAPVIAGPILCDRCKPEMQHLTISGPSIMQKAGVKLALCTDHPVIPIQYLPTTAALAVKGGMQREDALYAITAGAAEILGVENRIGSIAAGMDADLQLYRGDPLDLLCDPWLVMINGRRVAADLTPQSQE